MGEDGKLFTMKDKKQFINKLTFSFMAMCCFIGGLFGFEVYDAGFMVGLWYCAGISVGLMLVLGFVLIISYYIVDAVSEKHTILLVFICAIVLVVAYLFGRNYLGGELGLYL